ncbi:MAG: NUDIX domain-containing protein [Desulfurococcales archaeon]|nr:NUDIX domain-containing protein [Desulfurococcales archaeon]
MNNFQASVLLLEWGGHVLVVRKKCPSPSPWACDVALPGGRIKPGETPVEAALREAWEEAWVHPSSVDVSGILGPFQTMRGGIRIAVVTASACGPLDPAPRDPEVDAVLWIPLKSVDNSRPVRHPVRGKVQGILLPGGLVVWGVTYRILRTYRGLKGI